MDVIIKYLLQVIASTTILVLVGFKPEGECVKFACEVGDGGPGGDSGGEITPGGGDDNPGGGDTPGGGDDNPGGGDSGGDSGGGGSSGFKLRCWVVSTNKNQGTVEGDGYYPYLSKVTIDALPNEGYEFKYWLVSDELTQTRSYTKRQTITLKRNMKYVAIFKEAASNGQNQGSGNITIKDGETRVGTVGEWETNLNAYGNVLTSIEADLDGMAVTFTYIVGANLKAVLSDTVTDSAGNTRYYYSGYEYNSADSHGVTYTETYPFAGDVSEITEIIQNGDFGTYTNGCPSQYRYCTCPFSTLEATRDIHTFVDGAPVTSRVVIGRYSVNVQNKKDILVSPTFRDGSLVGVPFEPSVESDVFVNRGDSAAWERHMKLGECRSFDDIETYANGGFFNLTSQYTA